MVVIWNKNEQTVYYTDINKKPVIHSPSKGAEDTPSGLFKTFTKQATGRQLTLAMRVVFGLIAELGILHPIQTHTFNLATETTLHYAHDSKSNNNWIQKSTFNPKIILTPLLDAMLHRRSSSCLCDVNRNRYLQISK